MGRDGIVGCVLLALSLWLYRHTVEIPRPPFVPLGPEFYPRLLLGLLGGLSVALVGTGLLGPRETRGHPGVRRPVASYRDVVLTYVLFGAYVALIPLLGFRPATVLFVFVLAWSLGPRTVRHGLLSLLVAVGFTAAVHVVFEGYLRLLLPRGLLP